MDGSSPASPASSGGLKLVGCAVVLVLVGVVGLVVLFTPTIKKHPNVQKDRARSLQTMLLDIALLKNGYPPYNGKAFVLSIVAYGILKPEEPGALDVFFHPKDPAGSKRPSVEEYRALTKQRLRAGGDFRRFTSWVGRRNADRDAVLQRGRSADREPLLAYLYADMALVGFESGRVEVLDREELGLRPDDPITAGPQSLSPILRLLGE